MSHNPLYLIDILNRTTDYFTAKQIESPRLNAEILIAQVLKMTRVQLYLNFEKPLSEAEIEQIRSLVRRRIKHEPLQYITGESEFFSQAFKVNRHTLIPRPETEILVECVIEKCQSIPSDSIQLLDVGTGCGNIAISIAKNVARVVALGIDVQPQTLEVASENAQRHHVHDRVQFKLIDIFDPHSIRQINALFDIIVSNPPYIPEDEFRILPPEVKNFEPAIALHGGKDGILFYNRLCQISHRLLHKNGALCLEIGYNKGSEVIEILKAHQLGSVEIVKDLNGRDRVILAQRGTNNLKAD